MCKLNLLKITPFIIITFQQHWADESVRNNRRHFLGQFLASPQNHHSITISTGACQIPQLCVIRLELICGRQVRSDRHQAKWTVV